MASFPDMLASTCPPFISIETQKRNNSLQQRGSDYYLVSAFGNRVLVGTSIPRGRKNLIYFANRNFIIRYSNIYHLGKKFRWSKCEDFRNWINTLINSVPKFIQPHMRSIHKLDPPDASSGNIPHL